MAKRARGSTSRPGQRPPLQRQGSRAATRPPSPPPASQSTAPVRPRPDQLTDAEEARAAELEAAILEEERKAETAARRAAAARSNLTESARPRAGLAVSAAEEYQYVARDVRRISIVGGAMVVILLAIWVASQVIGFGRL